MSFLKRRSCRMQDNPCGTTNRLTDYIVTILEMFQLYLTCLSQLLGSSMPDRKVLMNTTCLAYGFNADDWSMELHGLPSPSFSFVLRVDDPVRVSFCRISMRLAQHLNLGLSITHWQLQQLHCSL
jgi:hypothetical protein